MREQLESERIRAAEVKQLLSNKYFNEAFDAAEKSILVQMDEVTLRDQDMHTRLIMAKKVLNGIRRYMNQIVETGKLAELQLREPNKFRSLFGR